MKKLPQLCMNLGNEIKAANIEGERLFQGMTKEGIVIISNEAGIEGEINLGECVVTGEYVIFAIGIPVPRVVETKIEKNRIYLDG